MSTPSPITGRPGPSGRERPVVPTRVPDGSHEQTADAVSREGTVDEFHTRALAGLLGVAPEPLLHGGLLPPMWHLVHLLDASPQADLGPDGHSLSGVPSPPEPGSRRMFAGGRTVHHHGLEIGSPALRTTRIVASVTKEGRSGRLTFVTVRHDITQAGRLCVVDEQDIVYKPEPPATGKVPDLEPETDLPSPVAGSGRLELPVDPVLLFRFSALTYNGHRIHYDAEYAAKEGYPSLVIHGPLQIVLAAEVLRRSGVRLHERRFAYRLLSPAVGAQRLAAYRVPNDPSGDSRVLDSVEVWAARQGLVSRGRLEEI
jgi:3-methylfumaryl-CoA hydratase